jgi:hypothetical protein
MPPIEIPGLKEEIEKGEFSSWSDDDLIQFMYEPGGSLPNLQNLHRMIYVGLLLFTNSNGGISRPSNSQTDDALNAYPPEHESQVHRRNVSDRSTTPNR